MRYLFALFFPWAVFFTVGKVGQGIIHCLILQCTLVCWLPATIWAFISIAGHHADKLNYKLIVAINKKNPEPAVADLHRI